MRCEHCRVTLDGDYEKCPLCGSDLSGEPDMRQAVYPTILSAVRRSRLFLSIAAFLTVATATLCLALNFTMMSDRKWSLFVVAGIACLWLSFGAAVAGRGNIPKSIIAQTALISAVAFVWDLCTGFGRWSINYVLPILCTCAVVAIASVAKIMKISSEDFIFYLVIDGVLGLISLVLLLFDVVSVTFPSVICVVSSVLLLAALLFFRWRQLKSEITRRLHL